MERHPHNWFNRNKLEKPASAGGEAGSTPAPSRGPQDPGEPNAAADPAESLESGAPPSLTAHERALEDQLTRIIGEQCDFLLRVAPAETQRTDAPLVIECLRQLDQTVIRQPPAAAQRALSVARDPASSLSHLATIFEQDPAMTRALLQAANSNYYRRSQNPCLSIPEAIQGVGFRGVESIVTATMVEGVLCRPGNAYAPLLTEVWSHMTRTAPIARSIAPAADVVPESAFTVGLLHDLGKLIIFDHVSRLRARHRREIGIPERFMLNMLNWLHEPLGGIAALRWSLGVPAARAIAWHHCQPPPTPADPLGETLCVAELADHALRLRKPLDLPRAWQQIGLRGDMQAVRDLLLEIPGVISADESDGGSHGAARAA